MRTAVKTTTAPELKRMTLPFIGKSLKSMGMEAQRDGNAYYVDLGHDSCLVIGFRRGRISVAVVMPADWDAVEELLFFASLTMASTTPTKVVLGRELLQDARRIRGGLRCLVQAADEICKNFRRYP